MSNTDQISILLNIPTKQINATVELLDAGNTIPFIARYRKEVTGSLDEKQIRAVASMLEKLRLLDERRNTILRSIDTQGVLTPVLKDQILAATTRTELEDLYQPYKPKRRTRASFARENGLQPLADQILLQESVSLSLDDLAVSYINDVITDTTLAWAGARDIVAEIISDHPEVRRITRLKAAQWGSLRVERIKNSSDPRAIYQNYYNTEMRLDRLRPHQILAIKRGETENILRVNKEIPERVWRNAINSQFKKNRNTPLAAPL